MPKKIDCLIIGGGVAGSVAASVLAKKNRKVMLVSKAGSATEQSSGGIDVAYSKCQDLKHANYIEACWLTAKHDPYHPYAKFSKEQFSLIDDALAELKSVAQGVDLTGTKNATNLIAGTQFGTLKSTALVQRTQAFDFNQLKAGDSLLIIGFSGLPSFDAKMVAENLKWSIKTFLNLDVFVEVAQCDMRPQKGSWRSLAEMAMDIDANLGADLEVKIRNLTRNREKKYLACLMPAVLGRHFYKNTKTWLNEEGTPLVYELLALPHSIPGARLQDALKAGLLELPIEIVQGEAVSSKKAGDIISQVSIRSLAGEQFDVSPEKVILCSGRFFAGGFERSGYRREKIFDLPLWYENRMIENAHVVTLTEKDTSNKQPIFNCGLLADKYLRPLDGVMRVFSQNLFAAGSSLGGYDAFSNGSSLGLAALTGYVSAFHTLKHNFME